MCNSLHRYWFVVLHRRGKVDLAPLGYAVRTPMSSSHILVGIPPHIAVCPLQRPQRSIPSGEPSLFSSLWGWPVWTALPLVWTLWISDPVAVIQRSNRLLLGPLIDIISLTGLHCSRPYLLCSPLPWRPPKCQHIVVVAAWSDVVFTLQRS